jgi:polyisoprenyl-phosphate glycosyltransferase
VPVYCNEESLIYYKLLRRFVVTHYPDGGYDMALMDKTILPYLLKGSKNMYTPILVYWLGFQPEVIAYKRRKCMYRRSRWTFNKKLTAAIDAIFGFSYIPSVLYP